MTYEKEQLCKYLLSQGKCDNCPMTYSHFFCEKNTENLGLDIENLEKMRKDYRK
jgi:hypothetical protein